MADSLEILNNELQESWQMLRQRWQATTEIWEDVVRRQFEKEFWQPLESQTRLTQVNLEQLAQVVTEAKRNVH